METRRYRVKRLESAAKMTGFKAAFHPSLTPGYWASPRASMSPSVKYT